MDMVVGQGQGVKRTAGQLYTMLVRLDCTLQLKLLQFLAGGRLLSSCLADAVKATFRCHVKHAENSPFAVSFISPNQPKSTVGAVHW